ncbi:hypothetical protein ACO0QE_000955 [Hanseniaspora vineae]
MNSNRYESIQSSKTQGDLYNDNAQHSDDAQDQEEQEFDYYDDDDDNEYAYQDDEDFLTKSYHKRLTITVILVFCSVIFGAVFYFTSVYVMGGDILNCFKFPELSTYRHINVQDFFAKSNNSGYLVFIGDVHGEYYKLVELTEKVESLITINHHVDSKPDIRHVLLGDFVSKGPYSKEVVQWMQQNDANVECIFGNHEVTTLSYKSFHKRVPFSTEPNFIANTNKIKNTHRKLYRKIGLKNLLYVAQKCSAMLHFSEEELSKNDMVLLNTDLNAENKKKHKHMHKKNNLIAVHAGILPNEAVDPIHEPPKIKNLISMKYVDESNWDITSSSKNLDPSSTSLVPSPDLHSLKTRKLIKWWKLWNDKNLSKYGYEKKLGENEYTIFYGHAAAQGLNIRKRTRGMDSGCVTGGQLSAYVISIVDGKIVDEQTNVISVQC